MTICNHFYKPQDKRRSRKCVLSDGLANRKYWDYQGGKRAPGPQQRALPPFTPHQLSEAQSCGWRSSSPRGPLQLRALPCSSAAAGLPARPGPNPTRGPGPRGRPEPPRTAAGREAPRRPRPHGGPGPAPGRGPPRPRPAPGAGPPPAPPSRRGPRKAGRPARSPRQEILAGLGAAEGAAAPGSGGSGIIFYQRRDRLPHPVTGPYTKALTDLEKLEPAREKGVGEKRAAGPGSLTVPPARPPPPPQQPGPPEAAAHRRPKAPHKSPRCCPAEGHGG
ncbi:proline-rich protein 2-like [Anser cygnoides]|uniref:proline-rich protein 2-like n=1 Tax=Anser cygnoides TaxID=8845 RepID=UPI0034D16B8E